LLKVVLELLGDRLRQQRKQRKLTQENVAQRIGVARTTYAMYEQNSREPDNETLQKLADFFEVSIDYLLGRTNDPTPPDPKPNVLPSLSPRDERDIGRDLERIMNNLESEESLAFHGEPLDEEGKELLRISLENSMRLTKQIAKQKFTPKKFK
jgi:transcriptional regulator with XRE-family HTH domain